MRLGAKIERSATRHRGFSVVLCSGNWMTTAEAGSRRTAARGDGIIPEPMAGIRSENCGKRREIAGNFGMGTLVSPRFRFTSWENYDWRNHWRNIGATIDAIRDLLNEA